MAAEKSPKSRLFFVNRFYKPDESATSQILSDLAEHLVESGFDVTIITSRLSYADKSVRHPPQEVMKGVTVKRVWSSGFGRAGLIGRAVDYLSFYLTSFFAVLRLVGRGDIVVAKTDPPLISVPVGFAARIRGARRVNWLQDLFPEVATALGVRTPLSGFLKWLRNQSLHWACLNVAIGDIMAQRLKAEGVREETIRVIHNFADDETLKPGAYGIAELRQEWGLEPEDFVIGYSGNLGRAHDFKTILGAAKLLKDKAHIKFLFIGGGHLRALVKEEANRHGLHNLIFKPYQPREKLAVSLGVPDIHWISLMPDLEGLIVPSKLYGVAAVGRPVLMIGDETGEIANLLNTHGFGEAFSLDDAEALAARIDRMSGSPESNSAEGEAARAFIDSSASRAAAFRKWVDALEGLSV